MQIPNCSCVIIFLQQKINTFNDACKCTTFFIYPNKKKKKNNIVCFRLKKTVHFYESRRYLCEKDLYLHVKKPKLFQCDVK
jgi:hypothetical protein